MNQKSTDKAKEYSTIKEYLRLFSIPLEFIFLFLMIFFVSEIFVNWTGLVSLNIYIRILTYGFLFFIFHVLFSLPLNFYSGYLLEHRFKLSNEKVSGWLKFQFKSLIFSLVLGLPLIILFYFILFNFPDIWWFIAATASFIVSVLLSYIFPYLIPFFYKLKKIEDQNLIENIKQIIYNGGLKLKGVYSIELGERTKKANAALTGLGKSKKVLLSDTLVNSDFTQEEITSVTAHEVGHYVKHHMIKIIFIEMFLTYSLFIILYLTIDSFIKHLSSGVVTDLVNFPVLLLVFAILNLLIEPINNFLSRTFEYQADKYAVKVTKKYSYISALERLAKQNLADKNPPRFIEILFHSHPSINNRIKKIQELE